MTLRQGSITIADHTISIHEYSAHDYSELYEMLASVPRTFPPKMIASVEGERLQARIRVPRRKGACTCCR